MPIEQFEIPASDSGAIPAIKGPIARYQLNEMQQAVVLGIDFNTNPVEFGASVIGDKIVTSSRMGKLSEQGFIMGAMLRNSLVNDVWNFYKYPDPEIILLDTE